MERVYIETSIPSYLVQKPSGNTIIAGHQAASWQWWQDEAPHFQLYTSQIVIAEASAGDSGYASQRLALLASLPLLQVTRETLLFARTLEQRLSFLMPKARIDILHMALATVSEMDYLLTWNCKHMANGQIIRQVQTISLEQGFRPVMIVTPDELMLQSAQEDAEDVP